MNWRQSLKITLLLTAFLSTSLSAQVLMYVRDDVYLNYLQFLDGRNVLEVKEFKGEFIRRDVVDMVIIQQALALGGFEEQFDYAAGKVTFRNTRLLQDGKLLLSFDSYWLRDAETLKSNIYISEPVIRKGEYHAGIFASPEHPSIFSVKTLSELQKYSAVSTPKWRTDWSTLESLQLKKLHREDEWVSQARMVNMMWIDFFLMPFNSNGKDTYELESVTLKHVPKVAVLLDDSRHFVVSKKHPLGKQAFEAINIGLKKLRDSQTIVKAYKQAGFFLDLEQFSVLNN